MKRPTSLAEEIDGSSLIDRIAARPTAMTVEDLAETLSMSKRAIYDMARDGRLACMSIGGTAIRFDPIVVARWLRESSSTSQI
jgi:excisionase family DNA binding protein